MTKNKNNKQKTKGYGVQTEYYVPSGVQTTMINLLSSDKVHGMALFAFIADPEDNKIKPVIIVADDMAGQKEFIDSFYALCDKHLDFKHIYDMSEQLLKEQTKGEKHG